jgi:TonB family protein
MLHPFISAAATGRIHPTFATASAAVHAAILFLAVAPTHTVQYIERPQASLEHVQFAIAAFGNVPLRVARALVATQLGSERLRTANAHAVLSDFRRAIPIVTAPAADEGDRIGSNELKAVVLHAVPKPPIELVFPDFTYEMADVETEAVPAPVNPKPLYPAAMQRRQLEARFAVYFVVDTSGRVDRTSVELPLVSHEEFANAVLDALEKWRFAPAEVGGHRVRERVKQPFYFRLQ